MLKTALILLNGEMRDPKSVRSAAKAADAVICADGGSRHAKTLGIIPGFIVGDMDSLPRPLPRTWKKTVYWSDFGADRSDLNKALDFASSLGARRAIVAGALGGGLDHEMINLAVLEKEAKDLELTVIDGGTARLLGPGRHRLSLKKGARFSLLAAPRARLSLSGARYRLKNEVLARGSRGLGNRAEGAVTLVVLEGRVWAIDAGLFKV